MKISWRAIWMALLLAFVTFATAGCATTEAENTSTRPWAAPQNWQYGIPGMDRMR